MNQFDELPSRTKLLISQCEKILRDRCRWLNLPDDEIRVVVEDGFVFVFANPVIHVDEWIDENGELIRTERHNMEFEYSPSYNPPEFTMIGRVIIRLPDLVFRMKTDGTGLINGTRDAQE